MLRRHVRDLLRLVGVRGERLLAQHVLAGLERGDRPPAVEPVRQRVVDRVHVGIGEERVVRVVHRRDRVLAGELLGSLPVTGRHGDDLDLVVLLRGLDQRRRGDAGRAERADPEPVHEVRI